MVSKSDVALNIDRVASFGGVVRDVEGVWKIGFNRNLGDFYSPNVFLVELLAVQSAINLIINLDFPQVIVESDSIDVVNLLDGQDVSSHQYEHNALDILQLKAAHGALVIRYAPRELNSLVDFLAKVGLSLDFGTHTFDSPFGECHSLMFRDLALSPIPPVGSSIR